MHLRIKVNPRSQKSEVTDKLEDGTLKVSLKSPPENGKANKELIEVLAKHFKVKKSQVKLITGHTSQIKLIRIDE